MKEKILATLERKQKQYREINAWFENEYDSSTSADTLAEWEKNATECHAFDFIPVEEDSFSVDGE